MNHIYELSCSETHISNGQKLRLTEKLTLKSIIVLFSIQTYNNNVHKLVNMNTDKAGNEVISLQVDLT